MLDILTLRSGSQRGTFHNCGRARGDGFISGGQNQDFIEGVNGDDTVEGDDGGDLFTCADLTPPSALRGNNGDDQITGGNGAVAVEGGSGEDLLTRGQEGDGFHDHCFGSPDNDATFNCHEHNPSP